MDSEKIIILFKNLVQNPFDNDQKFADVFSIDENWEKLPDSKLIPRQTDIYEDECLYCNKVVRTIYYKFQSEDSRSYIICPHCKEKIGVCNGFTGWTSELSFERYDPGWHG